MAESGTVAALPSEKHVGKIEVDNKQVDEARPDAAKQVQSCESVNENQEMLQGCVHWAWG